MIFDLQSSIQYLGEKSQAQSKQLDNLFLLLDEISLKKANIINPPQISYNFLHKFRIDIVDSILIFLDLPSLLSFRLVSNSANKLVLTTIPKKIELLKHQKQILESEVNEFQKELNPNEQLEEEQYLEQARQQMHNINKSALVEMKSLANPTQIVVKVMNFVQILLDSTYKPSQDLWKQAQKLLNDPSFVSKLITMNIDSITEKQVQQLQEVHQIELNSVQAASSAAAQLFGFVKFATIICESKSYQKKRNLKKIHQKIERLQKSIDFLKKIQK